MSDYFFFLLQSKAGSVCPNLSFQKIKWLRWLFLKLMGLVKKRKKSNQQKCGDEGAKRQS